MSLRIDIIPNQKAKPQILLRESWREGKRIRHKTVFNLTNRPPELVDALRIILNGGIAVEDINEILPWKRSLPHGHAVAALGTAIKLKLPRILTRQPDRITDLVLGAICARVIDPRSRLASARLLDSEATTSSLGVILGLGRVGGYEMLEMLDWLRDRQGWIERSLANRHLDGRNLALFNVFPLSFDSDGRSPAGFGYNRGSKKQAAIALLCNDEGCPVAAEVLQGQNFHPSAVIRQAERFRNRFGIGRLAVVGDPSLLTTACIRQNIEPAGLDWISVLDSHEIRRLLRPVGPDHPACPEPSAQSEDDITEIASPNIPGERTIACHDPRLRQIRQREFVELLAATEAALEEIATSSCRAGTNRDQLNRHIGKEAGRWEMLEHFTIEFGENGMTFKRNQDSIDAETQLDGTSVIRTSLDAASVDAPTTVESYRSLSLLEHAFRMNEPISIEDRPDDGNNDQRLQSYVFLCMLAYYVEWHMCRRLAPMLIEESNGHDGDDGPSAPATETTARGLPVNNFRALLGELSSLTAGEFNMPESSVPVWHTCKPTRRQEQAFKLLELEPEMECYSKLASGKAKIAP